MKPQPSKSSHTPELFGAQLVQILDTQHDLVTLANRIDWPHLDSGSACSPLVCCLLQAVVFRQGFQ